jgi:TRAP-type C4-dicarboxylate transport system substrate-binding protein
MSFTRLVIGCLGALAVAVAGRAWAQEVTLKVHTFAPPGAIAVTKLLTPWCDKVGKESAGRIKCQLFPSMQLGGSPPQLYDQVKDGVVDLAWTILGYTAGRFPATEVFELPFMTKSAEGASRALWEYAESNKLFASEFKDVKPIVLHVHDRGQLHTVSRQVKTLADFKGLRVRAPTRLSTKMLAAFGAAPVGMPASQLADALSKAVVDGALLPWEIVPAIKVHELVRFHSETGAGARALYTAAIIVAMNKAKYESMPAALRAVVDANSGAALSQAVGRIWDESAVAARKSAETRGNVLYAIPAAELAVWEHAAQPVYAEWVRDVGAKGLDGTALLNSARSLLAKHDGG